MKYYKIKKRDLKFDESIPCVSTLVKLPLLVTKNLEVLCGNGQRELLNDIVTIAIYHDDSNFARDAIKELDKVLCEENNYDRLMTFQKNFQAFILMNRQKYEQDSMFDFVETKMITEELYEKTKEYDFTKHNLVKKEEEDNGFMNLFEMEDEQ